MSPHETPRRLIIEGSRIVDIPTFYDEINRVFMVGETWTLGQTLDGLDDMLYGGYGVIAGAGSIIVEWRDVEATRIALGKNATRALLTERLASRTSFNGQPIADQIAALDAGEGKTYFDIVMDIFSSHPNIVIYFK